jgi:hypothetical protein
VANEQSLFLSVYQFTRPFWDHRNDFDRHFPRDLSVEAQKEYSLSLGYRGPYSTSDTDVIKAFDERLLFNVMCICRRNLNTNARDKVFGMLGVLPEAVQGDFPVYYSLSVKEVQVSVVDPIMFTTKRLEVIGESIHYLSHTSSANLLTWCPERSNIIETTKIGRSVPLSASDYTTAKYEFLNKPRRPQLQTQIIYLNTIVAHGIAVGILCTTGDHLMTFLH